MCSSVWLFHRIEQYADNIKSTIKTIVYLSLNKKIIIGTLRLKGGMENHLG